MRGILKDLKVESLIREFFLQDLHFYFRTKTNSLVQDIRPKANKLPIGPRLLRNPDIPRCTYDGNLPITQNPGASGI